MKQKPHIVIIFVLLLTGNVTSQTVFRKLLTGENSISARSITKTIDGGYIICGKTSPIQSSSFICKLNNYGDTVWVKIPQFSFNNEFISANGTSDSGIIVCGNHINVLHRSENIIIQKYNSYGTVNLGLEISRNNNLLESKCIRSTNDQGFVLCGSLTDSTSNNANAFMIKLSSSGGILWSRVFDIFSQKDIAYTIEQTTDSGFILGGQTDTTLYNGRIFLIKTDYVGNIIWSKTYGDSLTLLGNSIATTHDGGYIIAATQTLNSETDIVLFKTDSSGTINWTKSYNMELYDLVYSTITTFDDGYILTGADWGTFVPRHSFILKTDAAGNYQWSRNYENPNGYGDAKMNSAIQTPDGGYAVTSNYLDFSSVFDSSYVIRTDSIGNSGCVEITYPVTTGQPVINEHITSPVTDSGFSVISANPFAYEHNITTQQMCSLSPVIEKKSDQFYTVYPTPADEKITIYFHKQVNYTVELFDNLGRIIFFKEKSSESLINIYTGLLPQGIYFIRATIGNNTFCSKINLVHN